MLRTIIERLKLPFRKDRELRSALFRILGFYPQNIEYYKIAFAHKSQAFRDKKGQLLNNERLEFLGDAVLDTVVADILYHRFEGKREGFLTNTRSKIVSRETLNRVAEEIGLLGLVKFNTRQSAHNNYMGGNAFEALIGAIYLDKGYEVCKQFIENRIIGKYIDVEKISRKEVNFKSKLIEWSQKNRMELSFVLLEQGYDEFNSPTFESEVIIEGIHAGRGKGYSKKESQQVAAQESLNMIKKNSTFMEQILAVKAIREGEVDKTPVLFEQEKNIPAKEESAEHQEKISEREFIISAAEDAAFRGEE
jgi:ribonuclease-3